MNHQITNTQRNLGLAIVILLLAFWLGGCAAVQIAEIAQEERAAENWREMLAEGGHQFKGQGTRTNHVACWSEGGDIVLTIKPPKNPGEPNPVSVSAKFKGDFGPGCAVSGDEILNYPAWGEYDRATGQIQFRTCGTDGLGAATGFIHLVQKSGIVGEFTCDSASAGFLYKLSFNLEYVEE